MSPSRFDPGCERCPRLARHLSQVRADYPEYHGRPVLPFGDPDPDLLIIGLAPGMHGANATGRPFTGDYAGILLYQTLHDFGFSNQAESRSLDDGLVLHGCRITNAVKCLPPQNRPTPAEIRTCNPYLADELGALRDDAVILVLGRVAHEAVIRALDLRQAAYPFHHGQVHSVSGRRMVDSYHCSRYNTQTRRLTEPMFRAVFQTVQELLEASR